ncbi:helix-turn-helix domain-containing protein [Nocardia rhizosphaerihabitans]|uniref:HigA2-like helix-turn-helix domain-containing protein n=1 Tax=Nocardia rhizosphaerihabitans TaxID=1691570 RepID=A0ABQ2K7K2_9NOCA|nr:XRE family transcriptional regulator [Nocardia rhizosphaerihabitans]GGN71598.1 hypothetical protein GCM10011610_12010 [Nocardia rhizosphaerihabitans]
MTIQRPSDVWEAIAESPEEAERLRVWAEALDAVLARIDELELTPTQAAERLGVARSRIYEMRAGKQGVYSLERLIGFGARLGLHTHLTMRKTA